MRYGIILLVIVSLLSVNVVAMAAPVPPQVDAAAAVLMVADTKQVLFGKNQNSIMYPASTTKIMTLQLALEKGDPNQIVTVGSGPASCDGSSLELVAGDKITLRDLEYGLMLVSGNDAAEAIAEHIAGSVPAFVAMMNDKADKLGTVSTHFSNPHGLPDPVGHFTTAYDLALITAAGLKNPEFAKIVSTREYTVNFLSRGTTERITNTDKLLSTYPGATGVKTGYTDDAGECLVAAAKRGNVQLIAVILKSDTRWQDATNLLDYGFQLMAQRPVPLAK